jgi:hypothetical protein
VYSSRTESDRTLPAGREFDTVPVLDEYNAWLKDALD